MKNPLLIIAFTFIAAVTMAQNPNIKRVGQKEFTVGAYDHPFRFEKVIESAALNNASAVHWDWAACIMMVLNYNGLNVSQEQVMSLVNGDLSAPLSAPQDLILAINKTTPAAWGKPSKVYTSTATLDPDVLFDELSAGRPLIMGTGSAGMEGRAFVVTAMSYTIKFDANGQQIGITPTSVTLRDPWLTGLSNRTVIWTDFVPLTASLYTVKVEFKKG